MSGRYKPPSYFDAKSRKIKEFQRRFDGKTYAISVEVHTERAAKQHAKRLREKHGSARVIPDGPRNRPLGWLVYTPLKSKRSPKKTAKKTRKKSVRRTRDPLPDTKKLGGQRFELGRTRKTKKAANNVAKYYRDEGYKVRVVQSNGQYGIYVRRTQVRRKKKPFWDIF